MYSDENPKKQELLDALNEELQKNKREKGESKISYKFL